MGSALEATRCKERQSSNMKYLVLLALFSVAFADSEPEPTAAADPNADPWLYYGGGYYGGLGHRGYYGGLGHYGYGLGGRYLWGRKKREAEPTAVAAPSADAEADPWLYYGHGGYYGLGHGYYGGYGLGYARYGLGHTVWGRKKRSAEAEPAAEAEADPWYCYGLGHYGGLGYYGRHYGGYYGLGHRDISGDKFGHQPISAITSLPCLMEQIQVT